MFQILPGRGENDADLSSSDHQFLSGFLLKTFKVFCLDILVKRQGARPVPEKYNAAAAQRKEHIVL